MVLALISFTSCVFCCLPQAEIISAFMSGIELSQSSHAAPSPFSPQAQAHDMPRMDFQPQTVAEREAQQARKRLMAIALVKMREVLPELRTNDIHVLTRNPHVLHAYLHACFHLNEDPNLYAHGKSVQRSNSIFRSRFSCVLCCESMCLQWDPYTL